MKVGEYIQKHCILSCTLYFIYGGRVGPFGKSGPLLTAKIGPRDILSPPKLEQGSSFGSQIERGPLVFDVVVMKWLDYHYTPPSIRESYAYLGNKLAGVHFVGKHDTSSSAGCQRP